MRVNKKFTVAAGTPINLATGTGAAFPYPVYARSVFIQMKTNGSGNGYVMDGIYGGRVPSSANAADLTAELSSATPQGPGGSYSDQASLPQSIDANAIWVDGVHTGDVMTCSYDAVL